MTPYRWQFSLRTLLLVMTILSLCLAFIPTLTFACLCIAVGMAATIALVEFANYFHRFIVWVAVAMLALGGAFWIVLIVLAFLGQLEGYDAGMKWLALLIYGAMASTCFFSLGLLIAKDAPTRSNQPTIFE